MKIRNVNVSRDLIDKISDLEGNPDWQGLKKWNEKLLGLE